MMRQASFENNHSLDILYGNLEEYALFDPTLAIKLAEVECGEYHFCYTHLGELNLVREKEADGVPLYYHSMDGARAEANRWHQHVAKHLLDNKRIIVYGIGLGYYYDALIRWLDMDPENILIFIEDDSVVLRRFFETEKASMILSDPQVLICYFDSSVQIPEQEFINSLDHIIRGYVVGIVYFSSLALYATLKDNLCHMIRDQIFFISSCNTVLMNEISDPDQQVFGNYYSNLLRQHQVYDLHKLRNSFKGVPALICGAGPSIVNDIETIRELQDKAIIIASGTGMNVLNHYGIIPHFGTGLDPTSSQGTRIRTNFAYEVPVIYRVRFHSGSFRLIHGPKIFVQKPTGYSLTGWFEPKLGVKEEHVEESGISSSNFSMEIARILGCDPIILVGLDLAYTDASRYPAIISEHPADPPSAKQEISFQSDAPLIGYTKDRQQILTKVDWIQEANCISRFAKRHKETVVINATPNGLGIRNLINISLEEVRGRYLKKSFDLRNWIHAEIQNSFGHFDKTICETAMEEWKESIEACLKIYAQINSEIEKLKKRCGQGDVLPEAPYNGQISLLEADLWEEPAFKYLVAENAGFIDTITAPQKIRYRCHGQSFSQSERDLQKLEIDLIYLNFVCDKLNRHKFQLSAIFDDYKQEEEYLSQPHHVEPPQKSSFSDLYEAKNGVLRIFDEELGIDIEAPFAPQLLPEAAKISCIEGEALRAVFLTYHGELEGEYLHYYRDGKLLGESYYRQGRLHGPVKYFHPSGTLLAESWYAEGRMQGKNRQYYPSGALYSLLRYKDGKQHGRHEYYYEDGSMKSIIHYSEGKLHGSVNLYYSNGVKKRELHFNEGKLDGAEFYWDAAEHPVWEAFYRDGKPIGKARAWYSNHTLAMEYTYFNDQKHYNLQMWGGQGDLVYTEDNIIAEDMRESQLKKQRDLYKAIQDFKWEIGKYERLTKNEKKQFLF